MPDPRLRLNRNWGKIQIVLRTTSSVDWSNHERNSGFFRTQVGTGRG